jgi:hypothetical protein
LGGGWPQPNRRGQGRTPDPDAEPTALDLFYFWPGGSLCKRIACHLFLTVAEPSSASGSPSRSLALKAGSPVRMRVERNRRFHVFRIRYRSARCVAIEAFFFGAVVTWSLSTCRRLGHVDSPFVPNHVARVQSSWADSLARAALALVDLCSTTVLRKLPGTTETLKALSAFSCSAQYLPGTNWIGSGRRGVVSWKPRNQPLKPGR